MATAVRTSGPTTWTSVPTLVNMISLSIIRAGLRDDLDYGPLGCGTRSSRLAVIRTSTFSCDIARSVSRENRDHR
jgi:hypothetical protein